ncbi:DUF6049 family protein [Brevibacterium sp.]|uniref:DUF6049 family protein n=1 Tax=Brevibacterium sp. TaxID=1701 RepID=UPI002649CCBB|nr:DUF6049 family protein [Brevibacterium sp.]MDN6132574.1 DUF6049 family protein [Brevibacterium sp.]MDN6603170.1 DUF6049 family protein [Brevibacterium sp.]
MRFLLALLSTVLLLAGSVFAFPLMGSMPAAAATGTGANGDGSSTGVSITLDEVTPWVDEKGTLKVRGLITNSTDQAISNPDLRLAMSTDKLDAGRRIDKWKTDQSQNRRIADLEDNGPDARKEAEESGEESDPMTTVDAAFDDEIEAGSSAEFTFSVPAEQLGLRKSSPVSTWGPRGLSVQVGDASGLLASAVGFSTWYPSPKFDKTKVSILAPVTLPDHTSDGIIDPDELEKAIGKGGSLSTIMNVLDTPGVGIALDPRVVASFESAVAEPYSENDGADSEEAEEPSPQDTETATTGRDAEDTDLGANSEADEEQRKVLDTWYHDFLDEAKSHTVIALPYGDPDQASLLGSDLKSLGTFAQKQRKIVKDVLPKAKTDIAWPIAGSAQRDQLDDFADAGDQTVILSNAQQPSLTGVHDDAHSKTRITSDAQESIDTLISDSALAQQSAQIIESTHPASDISELVATTAAIQAEAPYDSRHLLLPMPRTAASANWEKTVEAIADAPWVDPSGVDELLDTDVAPRGVLQPPKDPKSIGAKTVQSLTQTRATQKRFNSVFSDPESADTRLDRELLSCTSVAWTLGGNAKRCADDAQAASEKVMNSIYLEKGSSVLLVTGEETTIPVTIVNDSPADATMSIRMKPKTPQLRAEPTETVVVPAQETMRVDVPVEGIANADVPTTIEMIAADDFVLPKSETLLVRVRADWENIGTAVIGLGLAAVFVIGLIKTISRGRRKIPEQQLADAMARAKNDESETR